MIAPKEHFLCLGYFVFPKCLKCILLALQGDDELVSKIHNPNIEQISADF